MADISKSRILVVGATGYAGTKIVKASLDLGHPTFALVRPRSMNDSSKSQVIESMKNRGATLLQGSLDDYESLVEAVRMVDVVICCIGTVSAEESTDPSSYGGAMSVQPNNLLKQMSLIKAIKQVGHIKRFLPSEFGSDVPRSPAGGPLTEGIFQAKLKIRQEIESSGIPYTYVLCNGMAAFYLASLCQPGLVSPPTDKVLIYGDGNTKACILEEGDLAMYTILAADDERTLNKSLHMRPPANTLTQNEMVALWERKIHKTLQKSFISEEDIIRKIKETGSFYMELVLLTFIKGAHSKFPVSADENGVEATALYPDHHYVTADEYLSRFVN